MAGDFRGVSALHAMIACLRVCFWRLQARTEEAEYKKILAIRHKEAQDARKHALAKKKRRLSHSVSSEA